MHNLTCWYQQQIQSGKLNWDPAQLQLLEELDTFLQQFSRNHGLGTSSHWWGTSSHGLSARIRRAIVSGRNFIIRRCSTPQKLGYYIYGGVGRGKSLIMNAMYQFTSGERKTRTHFHQFMQMIHQQLAALNCDDPLTVIAKNLKQQYDIIYLDEMHISDIATAMILQRLLESMFSYHIYLVTSSNYHPDDLWPDGLMRERFLPAIAVLKQQLTVVPLAAQQDYRQLHNSLNKLFIVPATAATAQLEHIFSTLNHYEPPRAAPQINICGRKITLIKQGDQVIWFDFSVLCGAGRSQLDYLELAQQFKWFILSDIFSLTTDKKDMARRFTWLIDILYDNSCGLALSSTVILKDIYVCGDFATEFERTLSRLEEMQTQEYLQKELTADTAAPYTIALESK